MANVVQQSRHDQRLYAANGDAVETTFITMLQQRAQGTYGQVVATKAMFVARVGCPRPDAIDEAQLFYFLQAQKWSGTDQFLFAWTERDQVVQTVTNGADWLFIW